MSPVIRRCGPADVEALRDLLVRTWHATFDESYGKAKVNAITSVWHTRERLIAGLGQAGSVHLVAERAGRIVGTVSGSALAAGGLKLERLYVAPEQQGIGVGRTLMQAFADSFLDHGFIALDVAAANERAQLFYRRQGFEIVGESVNSGTGEAMRTMRKVLDDRTPRGAPVVLRPVRDSDAQDLIGLITLCFAEHPGCYFDPHGDMPDIVRPAQSRLATEGRFLAVEDPTGRVCACIGVDLPEQATAELHRLYVRADMRGRGLGSQLTGRMETLARERGAARMILWSDTRFTTAHALYEKLGYARGPSRSLGDISQSREFFFEKALAAAESAA